jgi:hypothetical protein
MLPFALYSDIHNLLVSASAIRHCVSRLTRLFELFEPVEEPIEEFALKNKEEASDFIFHCAHGRRRPHTIVSHETLSWAQIHPRWIYPLRVKRTELITIMVAIVTALIAASIVTIFNAVEIEKLKTKQQKAEIMTKLSLMALQEISNSQAELIRLTSKVVGSLLKWWANMDTIQHFLIVCDVADQQVDVIESVMQAAMGRHMPVAAFT